MAARTFKGALRAFVASSPWLDEEHEPELMALRFLADQLDSKPSSPAPLVAQWGLTLRNLRKQAPAGIAGEDELEQLLKEARSE